MAKLLKATALQLYGTQDAPKCLTRATETRPRTSSCLDLEDEPRDPLPSPSPDMMSIDGDVPGDCEELLWDSIYELQLLARGKTPKSLDAKGNHIRTELREERSDLGAGTMLRMAITSVSALQIIAGRSGLQRTFSV